MKPIAFKAPFISKDQIREAAAQARPAGIPVDVHDYLEFDLGFEIRPVDGLLQRADIEALVLRGQQTVIVDRGRYMDARTSAEAGAPPPNCL